MLSRRALRVFCESPNRSTAQVPPDRSSRCRLSLEILGRSCSRADCNARERALKELTEHFSVARVDERLGDVGSARSHCRLAPATGPLDHASGRLAPSGAAAPTAARWKAELSRSISTNARVKPTVSAREQTESSDVYLWDARRGGVRDAVWHKQPRNDGGDIVRAVKGEIT